MNQRHLQIFPFRCRDKKQLYPILFLIFLSTIMAFLQGCEQEWYKKDLRTRLKEVAKIEDQERLKHLVLVDKYRSVREAALNKITNQEKLEDIVTISKKWEVRLAALNKIENVERRVELALNQKGYEAANVLDAVLGNVEDQEILIQIFKQSAPYIWKQKMALQNTTDQNFLLEVLFGAFEEDFRLIALNRLLELDGIDQDSLKKIMYTGRRNRQLRLAAFEHIDDLEFVKKLALTEPKGEIQNRAAKLWAKTLSPKLADQIQIKHLALYSTEPNVRGLAWKLLNDPDLLKEIALRGEKSWQRLNAIEKITDDAILKKLAMNDPDKRVRIAAAKLISNQDSLFEVITSRDGIENVSKIALVRKLTELDKIQYIAQNYSTWNVRRTAIERLKDPQTLRKIIENDKNSSCREAAIRNLDNQQDLAELALTHALYGVRKEAVKHLTDQSALAEVAQNDPNSSVRQKAVLLLSNQKVLKKVILNDQDTIVRSSAVLQIHDQEFIERVALTDPHAEVRYWAVRKVVNPDVLQGIVEKDAAENVRKMAQKMIEVLTYKTIDNQEQLARIVREDRFIVARQEALTYITDNQLLSGIVKELADREKYKELTKSALAKITDLSVLTELLSTGFYLLRFHTLDEQQQLLDKIDQPELLEKIGLNKNNSEDFRLKALLKIRDQDVLASILLRSEFHEIFEYIHDPGAIRKILLQPWKENIRIMAVPKCSSVDTLIQAGLEDTLLVRWMVLGRLHELQADPQQIQSFEQAMIDASVRQFLGSRGWDLEPLLSAIDPEIFKSLLRYRKYPRVYETVLLLMDDQNFLKNEASTNVHAMMRMAALPSITDKQFLKGRAADDPEERVRLRAVSLIKDQSILAELAFDNFHQETRQRATQLLRDQNQQAKAQDFNQQLLETAEAWEDRDVMQTVLEGKYDVWQTKAAKQVTVEAELKAIALQSDVPEVLAIVLDKINSPDVLRDIADSAHDPAMRIAASQKAGLKTWSEIFKTAQAKSEKLYHALAATSLFKHTHYKRGPAARNAAYYLLSRGNSSRIPEMIEILNRFGSKQLAEDFYNCKQPDLRAAARQWAKDRNYAFISYPTSQSPEKQWGLR